MPRKDKKEEVYEWIKKNVKEPISIRQIAERMGIANDTAYKWVYILAKEGKLQIKDYGIIKLVSPAPPLKKQKKRGEK